MGNMSNMIEEHINHIWIDSINDVKVRSNEYVEDDKMISISFLKENRVIPLSLLYEDICEYCFITCIYNSVIIILMKYQPFLSLQIDGDYIPTEQVTNLKSGITYTIKMNSDNDEKINILWIKADNNPTLLCLNNNEYNDSCSRIHQSKIGILTTNISHFKKCILLLIIIIFYCIFYYIVIYFMFQ